MVVKEVRNLWVRSIWRESGTCGVKDGVPPLGPTSSLLLLLLLPSLPSSPSHVSKQPDDWTSVCMRMCVHVCASPTAYARLHSGRHALFSTVRRLVARPLGDPVGSRSALGQIGSFRSGGREAARR